MTFLVLVFLGPVAVFLSRSVIDLDVSRALPLTVRVLRNWNPGMTVPDAAYSALVSDLRHSKSLSDVAEAATRLNYALPGMRILLMRTRNRILKLNSDPKTALTAISAKWQSGITWSAIKNASGPVTDFYLLAAVDLQNGPSGAIEKVPPTEGAFIPAIERTFEIALGVTSLTIVFGFPFAYLMATSSARVASVLMIAVLVPFWTSIMVRVLSWLVLLGREGVINDALSQVGLLNNPINLLFTLSSVYLALVQIFVPYMIFPLYAAMKNVPRSHLHAAASLGASPYVTFWRVYLPQVAPGLAAGSLLVFIQCLGVFVVPAILGGADDQNLPMLISFYVINTLNWGLAAALSVVLLISVCIFYWLFVSLTKNVQLAPG